ncbi:MAG: ATP-binding protein [Acidimicrobiales bacterium]
MSSLASQLQFAAELLTLLVAAGGLILMVLRDDLTGGSRWARGALSVGFAAMGVAAFAQGSALVTTDAHGALSGLRLAGDAVLAAGSLRWSAGRGTRGAFWVGIGLSAAAAVLELTTAPRPAADVVLVAGGLGITAALVVASRRSIAAQVAASAATTLLVVVLVLSIALSALISSSVQNDQVAALRARGLVESSQARAAATGTSDLARLVAVSLQGTSALADLPDTTRLEAELTALARAVTPAGGVAAASANLAFVLADGTLVTPGRAPAAPALDAIGHMEVNKVLCLTLRRGQPVAVASQIQVVTGDVVAWATAPECQGTSGLGAKLIGAVVAYTPLDANYLAGRQGIDNSTSLAVVSPCGVLAASPPSPSSLSPAPGAAVTALVGQSELEGRSFTRVVNGQAVSVQPLVQPPPPARCDQAAIVLSTSSALVEAGRSGVQRAIFLVALGGTLLALLLVAAVGERATAGLSRLTEVAERIRGGDTGERVGMSGSDEVAVLGAAFDSMVESIEVQRTALQAAADDETRLRNRLQAVVAGMGEALVATDRAGRVTDFNSAAEELTQTAARSALGRPAGGVVQLVSEDGRPIDLAATAPATAGASRWSVVGALGRPDRSEIPVLVSSGTLRGSAGEAAGRVLVLRDLRRERELDRMKSEFLSRVGHELRTPLTGILGYAEILVRRTVEPDKASQWYGEILQSGKRLERIVELLEFFASSGADRVVIRPEPISARVFLAGVAFPWKERLGKGHPIVRRVDPATPPLYADRSWLALAVDELIDNAVKFSPEGGRVGLAASPGWARGVEIRVSDRGVGMTAAQREVAFAEFVQGDESDTRRFGGLGLGLALVRRVVEGHGGSVTCRSAPGRGSTFTIRLPGPAGR